MAEPAPLDELLASALELGARQLSAAQADDWECVAVLQQELEAVIHGQEIRALSNGDVGRLHAAISKLASRNDAVMRLAMTARDRVAAGLGELRAGRQAKRAYSNAAR